MDNEQFIKYIITEFDKIVPLDSETIRALLPLLSIHKIDKKAFLLKPGHTSNTMNFIAKGCMRSFYLDDNANEHILQFGLENWWINDLNSYLNNEPSRMFIQAIEPTVLVQIKKDDLEKLYLELPIISNFFRIKFQEAYVALQDRMISSMTIDAYGRYKVFIKNYRKIEQRIPQYMVAAYLGITPEFLSHLRKINAAGIS
ncbi:Crp/Fnr family transcriptional regulator [Aequorivita sp. SDUM287046]|uniref:Crp/Fnr family transcriptional regulator n=1 Tax=Aequorivita aurantiaca TaxID=3053356 RepID=A0ABT8DMU8_9FLAO|nr:Crp/Fnr family transcriptional regulator [Aequorivita aurantiaca]MDN3725329.1 Crp/Fnr family transcriptional regulator [Aequorivita aurantiaca]